MNRRYFLKITPGFVFFNGITELFNLHDPGIKPACSSLSLPNEPLLSFRGNIYLDKFCLPDWTTIGGLIDIFPNIKEELEALGSTPVDDIFKKDINIFLCGPWLTELRKRKYVKENLILETRGYIPKHGYCLTFGSNRDGIYKNHLWLCIRQQSHNNFFIKGKTYLCRVDLINPMVAQVSVL